MRRVFFFTCDFATRPRVRIAGLCPYTRTRPGITARRRHPRFLPYLDPQTTIPSPSPALLLATAAAAAAAPPPIAAANGGEHSYGARAALVTIGEGRVFFDGPRVSARTEDAWGVGASSRWVDDGGGAPREPAAALAYGCAAGAKRTMTSSVLPA